MGRTSHLEVLALIDGAVVHIADLDADQPGKHCVATCAHCGTRLWAKMGTRRVWHFAHPSGLGCGNGTETALHLEAKRILQARGTFRTPPASFEFDGEHIEWIPSYQLVANRVELEKDHDGFVPDAVFVRDGKPDFLVEIRVAHECPDDKVTRISSQGLPCVEVDVRSIRLDGATFDRAALERLLVSSESTEDKRWLHLPGYQDELERRRRERQRSQDVRDSEIRAQLEARRRATEESARRADAERQRMARLRSGWSDLLATDSIWRENLEVLGLAATQPKFLWVWGIQGGDLIKCPPPTWQSEIWVHCMRRKVGERVRIGDAVREIVRRHPDWIDGASTREVGYAVGRYFTTLAQQGNVRAVPPHYGSDPESWVWELVRLPQELR